MDLESAKTTSPHVKDVGPQTISAADNGHNSVQDSASKPSAFGITTWAKSLKLPQPMGGAQDDSSSENTNTAKSPFARFTSGLGLRLSPKAQQQDNNDNPDEAPTTPSVGIIGTLTKGFVDTSKNAVKAVQVKARHVVSQNKLN